MDAVLTLAIWFLIRDHWPLDNYYAIEFWMEWLQDYFQG